MRIIRQFTIILAVSFAGEILNYIIPLPIPASIYGLVIMFVCLRFKVIKLGDVKETSGFLIDIMPLMFIPAAVGLITSWNILKTDLIAYIVITVVTTFAVMVVSGRVTQLIIRHEEKRNV